MDVLNLNYDGLVTSMNGKADKDFLNCPTRPLLENQITNCILEAPHMVDLYIEDGWLCVHKGSKVIFPWGRQAPDKQIGDVIQGCTIVDISWDGDKLFYIAETNTVGKCKTNSQTNVWSGGLVYTDMLYITSTVKTQNTSGSTNSGNPWALFYNTDENIVYYNTDTMAAYSYVSLPICVAKTTAGSYFTSIDQIFQHIGYIGSHVWAMKNITICHGNGFENNSYRNEHITTQYVQTYTREVAGKAINIYFHDSELNWTTAPMYYDEDLNMTRNENSGVLSWNVLIAKCSVEESTYKISNFTVKKPNLRVLTNNDTEYIAHQAMPSERYVDLSTSTTQYTAPADGYIYVEGTNPSTPANIGVEVYDSTNTTKLYIDSFVQSITGWGLFNFVLIKKGNVARFGGTNTNITTKRFFYAEGAK